MKKIDSLQALRAIAFLCVFTFHGGLSDGGTLGVSIFILLSGFLMYYQYEGRELKCTVKDNLRFAIGKLKKIYILHILMMVLSLVYALVNIVRDKSVGLLIKTIVKSILNITLLQAWVPFEEYNMSLNGIAWYLSVCLLIYFIFPWIHKKWKPKNIFNILEAIIIVYFFQFLLDIEIFFFVKYLDLSKDMARWATYTCPLYRLADFFIGYNVGMIYFNLYKNRNSANISVYTILELLSVALIYIIHLLRNSDNSSNILCYYINVAIYTPIVIFIIILFTKRKGLITKLLSNRILIKLGNISGVCYIIHLMVLAYEYTLVTKLGLIHNAYIEDGICLLIIILSSLIWSKTSFWNTKSINKIKK